ncbi:MAG: TauD/TfdA family dioxygenase [Acidimicrobiales bacterium]
MSSHSPATPDFYDYEWQSLVCAEIDGEVVAMRWADGTVFRANGWWLRESVVADGATDPTTREGTIDPARHPEDLAVSSAAVDEQGALLVEWTPDGFRGTLHPGWLRHVAEGRHAVDSGLPRQQHWTAATLEEPPTFSGPAVLQDDATLRAWLVSMVRYGIGRLVGLPTDTNTVVAVTDRIGPQRGTNFGYVWSVKAEILGDDQNTTANTQLRLGPHTDLPTREVPPGFQFLHCVANTCEGGWSRLTDGAALAAHLEVDEPDTYEALTSLRWVFFNRSRDHDHRWSGPMIDPEGPGSPLTIRAFYPVRAFPDMAEADVPRAYRAARRFHQLGADARFQIGYAFRPGDLIGFDNRRILHGRDAFDSTTGHRHLRGCYVDHDEIYSRLRVLGRRQPRDGRSQ